MVVYNESGPKTNRPARSYVGRSGEIVNSISPRISSGPLVGAAPDLLPSLLLRVLRLLLLSVFFSTLCLLSLSLSQPSGNSPTFVLCSVALPLVASTFTAPSPFIPTLGQTSTLHPLRHPFFITVARKKEKKRVE